MLPPIKNWQSKRLDNREYSIEEFMQSGLRKTDFDVYLSKFKINLQVGYEWSLTQAKEYIDSILGFKFIPPILVFFYTQGVNKSDYFAKIDKNISTEDYISQIAKYRYQIIDGKQRLMTHIKFIQNEFSIKINGKSYQFKDLPTDYQYHILNFKYNTLELSFHYCDSCEDELRILYFVNVNYSSSRHTSERIRFLKSLISDWQKNITTT